MKKLPLKREISATLQSPSLKPTGRKMIAERTGKHFAEKAGLLSATAAGRVVEGYRSRSYDDDLPEAEEAVAQDNGAASAGLEENARSGFSDNSCESASAHSSRAPRVYRGRYPKSAH